MTSPGSQARTSRLLVKAHTGPRYSRALHSLLLARLPRVLYDTDVPAPVDSKRLVENLWLAFELHEAGVALKRQNLRRRMPHASEEQIDAHLASWLRERPGAELGDAEGRAIPWPRSAP